MEVDCIWKTSIIIPKQRKQSILKYIKLTNNNKKDKKKIARLP